MRKKAQMGGLTGFVITLVIIGFVVAIGLTMMGELQETQMGDNATDGVCGELASAGCNATGTLMEETAGISDWYGIIVLAVIAMVILGIVMVLRRATVG